jgi:hypothetical protein
MRRAVGPFRPSQVSSKNESFDSETTLESSQWWKYVCSLIPESANAAYCPPATKSDVAVLMINGSADPKIRLRIWPEHRTCGHLAGSLSFPHSHTTSTSRTAKGS